MQDRTRTFWYLSPDDIPSSAVALTSGSRTAKYFYVPIFGAYSNLYNQGFSISASFSGGAYFCINDCPVAYTTKDSVYLMQVMPHYTSWQYDDSNYYKIFFGPGYYQTSNGFIGGLLCGFIDTSTGTLYHNNETTGNKLLGYVKLSIYKYNSGYVNMTISKLSSSTWPYPSYTANV